jgi:hypothetical protein
MASMLHLNYESELADGQRADYVRRGLGHATMDNLPVGGVQRNCEEAQFLKTWSERGQI